MSQANATSGVGFDPRNIKTSIYECVINQSNPKEHILRTETPNLYLLPSHIDLVGAEIELIHLPNRERMMKNVLEKIKDQYDFIVLDCSPSLGLITINALTASDSVIIPVQCEYFALEGLGKDATAAVTDLAKALQDGDECKCCILPAAPATQNGGGFCTPMSIFRPTMIASVPLVGELSSLA